MAANTARLRPPPIEMPTRALSPNSTDSDGSDSSPDQERDEEASYFLTHANESQSTICPITGSKDDVMNVDTEALHRLTPISKLPPELLIAIFSKLTTTADLRNCMLVSYHWALYSVSILWHRPLCNKWSNLQNVANTLANGRPTFPYHEMVKRLNLSAVADKVNDGTAQPFMNCKSIERLTLTNCLKLTDFGVKGLVEGNKRLQALDVTDLEALTDRTMLAVAQNCAKLQGLNITNCHHVTDESLVPIAENCKQLKRLKLNGVYRATDQSVIAVAQNCRSILEIDLAGCDAISSESVTALLSNLPYLRELRLAQCVNLTDTAFTNLPPKLHFDALRILDLTQCENVRDDAIARIIPAAPRLRNLVLAKCRHITDRAVDAICKLTKNLHYIHLGHCTNLTDAAVINLVKHCNRIRYIDLACCSRLTDASVRHLAQLPKLRRIGLVKCQNLTDSSIMALAHGPPIFTGGKIPGSGHFVSLERVHLSYCVNLTLKGITALLNNCPRLTHLSLTGVQAFLREDLTRFCREAPPEFTHPQRDVFCVFSGEGVVRLRDHLLQLAMEEIERDHQNAMEESLLDPDDSPGADTMSDEGTIDGNEQGDIIYGPTRWGFASVSGSRHPARPRSMQDLHSANNESLPGNHEEIQRNPPWRARGSRSPDARSGYAAARLNLLQPGARPPSDVDPGLRPSSSIQMPLMPLDLDRAFGEMTGSRSQTRRHTLESGASFYTPPSPGQSTFAANPSRSFDTIDDPRLIGASTAMMPPSSVAGPSQVSRAPARPELFQPSQYLRPEPEFSAFDANHEAIMSTIPDNGSLGQSSSQSSSHHHRVSGRGRIANLVGTMRALSSPPSNLAEPLSRDDEIARLHEMSQIRNELRREMYMRAIMSAESQSRRRPRTTRAAIDHEVDLSNAPVDFQSQPPVSPATSRGSSSHSNAHAPQPAQNPDDHPDVEMGH